MIFLIYPISQNYLTSIEEYFLNQWKIVYIFKPNFEVIDLTTGKGMWFEINIYYTKYLSYSIASLLHLASLSEASQILEMKKKKKTIETADSSVWYEIIIVG